LKKTKMRSSKYEIRIGLNLFKGRNIQYFQK